MTLEHGRLKTGPHKVENRFWKSLLSTPEGRIFSAGLVMALLTISVLVLISLWMPEASQVLVAMTALNISFEGTKAPTGNGSMMSLPLVRSLTKSDITTRPC